MIATVLLESLMVLLQSRKFFLEFRALSYRPRIKVVAYIRECAKVFAKIVLIRFREYLYFCLLTRNLGKVNTSIKSLRTEVSHFSTKVLFESQ